MNDGGDFNNKRGNFCCTGINDGGYLVFMARSWRLPTSWVHIVGRYCMSDGAFGSIPRGYFMVPRVEILWRSRQGLLVDSGAAEVLQGSFVCESRESCDIAPRR